MKKLAPAFLTALALISTSSLAVAAADEEPFRTDINPALRYYQVMIRGPELSPADRDFLMTNTWRAQKLPERFIKLVSPLNSYCEELQRAGQAAVPCDWGVDFSRGPMTLLPHLARCRTLGRLTTMHALWELQEKDQSDACSDLIAAFALGRNSSRDRTLIAALVQFAIEDNVLNTVAENFNSFSGDSLQKLVAGFEAAPRSGTTSQSISSAEKDFSQHWLKEKILRWRKDYRGDDAKVMAAYRELLKGMSDGTDPAQWDSIVKAADNSDSLLKLLEDQTTHIDNLSQIMTLPHPAFEEQAAKFQHDAEQSNNPFLKLTFPSILKSRAKEFKAAIKLAMVHAAIVYKQRGESGLREVTDPTSQAPFHFERFKFKGTDRGFKLTSDYTGNGYPETMIFVEKDGKPFVCDGAKAGEPLPK